MDTFALMFNGAVLFPWDDERDTCSRFCAVNLYSREINGGLTDHWALHFCWGKRQATFEANEEGGLLIPTWNNGMPDCSFAWTKKNTYEIRCSPFQVNTKAKNLSLSGSVYILTKNNCHSWAIALAKELGIVLDPSIEDVLPTDLCNVIDVGYAIGNLAGIFDDVLSSTSLGDANMSSRAITNNVRSQASAATSARAIPSSMRAADAGALASRSSRAITSPDGIKDDPSLYADMFKVGVNVALLALNSFMTDRK